MIRQPILSTGREMPMRMVDLLDKLFWSQNIYLTDRYCFRKVVPKVILQPLETCGCIEVRGNGSIFMLNMILSINSWQEW